MINKKIKVLLLSAPIGSGHRLAAEALKETFENKENIEVVHGNVFDFFPEILGKTFLRVYLWILGACPWMYELMYKWGNKGEGSLWMRSLINGALAYLGISFIRKVAPDIVIATHATPAGIMSIYKRRNEANLYLCGVITDFTVHRWWVCDGVDTYFIADERLHEKIPATFETVAYGIPIRQSFQNLDKASCRKEFGWNSEDKVCLLMGGGDGLLPMEEIIASLIKDKPANLKLVALTGKNTTLYKKLLSKFGDSIQILKYTEQIPQLMCGADMIISKAGGLSSAEVLASNLDFIIYKPLPGQEENNAKFLAANCGATIASDTKAITQKVKELCKLEENIAMERAYYGKPQAAEKISNYILGRLSKI